MNKLAMAAIAVATLTAVSALPALAQQKTGARGITRSPLQGWPEGLHMESKDAPTKAVVVPAIGGRVMSYGLRDENILWINPDADGKALPPEAAGFEPGEP